MIKSNCRDNNTTYGLWTVQSRLEKEAEKERQFELKQQKRKEKHRGR
ncbi:DUF2992 family protein [Clostridium sp. D5]|nr:DUF2992 family protein [Clostridium sp. D5]